MTGMPAAVPTQRVETWVHRLQQVAAAAGEAITGARG